LLLHGAGVTAMNGFYGVGLIMPEKPNNFFRIALSLYAIETLF